MEIDPVIKELIEDALSIKFDRKVTLDRCKMSADNVGQGEPYESYLEKRKDNFLVRISLEVFKDENVFEGIDIDVYKFFKDFNLTPGLNYTVHGYNSLSKDGVILEDLYKFIPPALRVAKNLNSI